MKFGNQEVYLNPDLFCDARLVCQGGSINTHRLILGAGSTFLGELLKDHSPEDKVAFILPDFTRLDACQLLSVLYGDPLQNSYAASSDIFRNQPAPANDIFRTLRCNSIHPECDSPN